MEQIIKNGTSSPIASNVLILASLYEPAHLGGGPIQTLKALVEAAPERFKIKVICKNHDLGSTAPLVNKPNTWLPLNKIQVNYTEGGLGNLISAFKSARNPDILYLNSLFNSYFSILPMMLWRIGFWQGTSVLVAPRGELDPGALALKARKKRIFLKIFKLLRFPQAFIWHASSEMEAKYIRDSLGENLRIVIRENETSLPLLATEREPRKQGPLRLIFASRLAEKKGLHTLLTSLQAIKEPIQLDIVGAFEDQEYEKKCRDLATSLPGNIKLTFHGGVRRENLLEKFHEADLFTFPTAAENFGHAIAESLSQSCPVMCSTNTPWSKILNEGGGIVVRSTNPEHWAEALHTFLRKGTTHWEGSSHRAAVSFNKWRNAPKGQHVFELAEYSHL